MTSISDLCEMIRGGWNDQLESALLENPKLATQKTEQGISILMYAVYCQNKDAVHSIRRRKTHLDIFESASIGEIQTLKTLLREQPELLNAYSIDGFTLLGLACFFGHEEIAR